MPGTTYDRSEARTQILREMLDPTAKYFTTDLVNDRINDAMEQWCQDSRLRVVNGQIDIVANISVYSLTSMAPRVIEILRASCPTGSTATDDYTLRLMTQTDLDQEYPNWRSETASWPFAVIRDLAGPQSLRLYPTPASSQEATVRAGTYFANQTTGAMMNLSGLSSAAATAAAGAAMNIQYLVGSLQLYYVAGSTDISSDATTLETACGISPDFQDAIIFYVCARLCEMDTPISQQQKAQGYWAKYQTILQEAIRRDRSGMQQRPPRTVRGRPF
jgi:hypothetical protein